MDLQERVFELVSAGFSGIWVQTHDVQEAQSEIIQLARSTYQTDHPWQLACWDVADGYIEWNPDLDNGEAKPRGGFVRPTIQVARPGSTQKEWQEKMVRELPEALKHFEELTAKREGHNSQNGPENSAIFVVKNPHLTPPQTTSLAVQMLENEAVEGRRLRRHVICISTRGDIPKEVEKQYHLINHPLPSREKLLETLSLIEVDEDQQLSEEEVPAILNAVTGLTEVEASNAGSLSVIRAGKLVPAEIWELKAQILKKAKGLSLWRGKDRFSEIGGMNQLKEFCLRSIQNSEPDNPLLQAKGVMLLGVSGAGKSKFCKALGYETGRPTIILDVGSLKDRYYGQTEGLVRMCFEIVDAMSPCILMCDEIEKVLGGESAHEVTVGIIGAFLTWAQDHTSDVFTICTCNDIHKLTGPYPEFGRAGRFDGIFFVDLPTKEEKDVIWKIHLDRYKDYVDADQERPKDEKWTGAEIEECVKLAALHKTSLLEVANNVVPVAETSETIASLREWATDRCLSALHPGRYAGPDELKKTARGMSFASNGGQKKRRIKKRRRPVDPEQN